MSPINNFLRLHVNGDAYTHPSFHMADPFAINNPLSGFVFTMPRLWTVLQANDNKHETDLQAPVPY